MVLLGTPLFADVSPAELEPLAGAATIRRAVRGEHIFDAGDPADAVYVVVAGQLKDTIYSDDGEEVTHFLWEPGQYLGEVGFFARTRQRVMTLIALEPSTLLVLGRTALTTFLDHHPRVALTLLEHVASTSQWQTGMFLSLARRPLADRLILRLLDLAETSGSVEADRATTPRISQSTLAAMVGASRENVNRAVAVLAADGTLRVDRGRYVIADPDRVRRRVIAGAPTGSGAAGSADP
jgi:CRP/FNR family transcriptional regulator